MRHVDERDADLALDPLQLDLQALPQLQVEGAQGLVEQQHLGQLTSARASATRCCMPPESWFGRRFASEARPNAIELVADPPLDLVAGDLLPLEAEADVLARR